jgi:hypothetical protein
MLKRKDQTCVVAAQTSVVAGRSQTGIQAHGRRGTLGSIRMFAAGVLGQGGSTDSSTKGLASCPQSVLRKLNVKMSDEDGRSCCMTRVNVSIGYDETLVAVLLKMTGLMEVLLVSSQMLFWLAVTARTTRVH